MSGAYRWTFNPNDPREQEELLKGYSISLYPCADCRGWYMVTTYFLNGPFETTFEWCKNDAEARASATLFVFLCYMHDIDQELALRLTALYFADHKAACAGVAAETEIAQP